MSFGQELRRIRSDRRLSQLDLAGLTGVSQRHISYLESGKSNPSRGMVTLLARALGTSLRSQNGLLLAAGFAPAFADKPMGDPAFAKAREAVRFVLDRQEPCPAIALDKDWRISAVNRGMSCLLGYLSSGDPSQNVAAEGVDFLEALVAEQGLSQYLVNAERIACTTLERVQRDSIASGDDVLLARVDALLARYDRTAIHDAITEQAVLPSVEFVRDGTRLRFLSIMVAFATPCAIELAALRIEVFYPADEATQQAVSDWRRLTTSPVHGRPDELQKAL